MSEKTKTRLKGKAFYIKSFHILCETDAKLLESLNDVGYTVS